MIREEKKRGIISIVMIVVLLASSLMFTACGTEFEEVKVVDGITLPVFGDTTFENHDALNALF